MQTEQTKVVKNSIRRVVFVGFAFLIQLSWIILIFLKLNRYSIWINLFTTILALLVVLKIYGLHMNSAFKIPWIMLILVFPVMGLCLYMLLGHSNISKKMKKRFISIDMKLKPFLVQEPTVTKLLKEQNQTIFNQVYYIEKYGSFPIYQNTDVEFYSEAEKGLEAQKEALLLAKNFIFMEYHAIEDAESFCCLKKILSEKVRQGVEVRILYDDVGSVGFINKNFIKHMEAAGIQCRVFNPLLPILNVFMNHRDHRKITVIDGIIGFTGGYNLADEYFNITTPFGHWKDTGLKLVGNSVHSLTALFLEMWNVQKNTDVYYSRYFPSFHFQPKENCFVQPYADSPLNGEPIGENIYMNIIKNTKNYVYFTTPYLIISDEMSRELGMAAKRGVDVRIITPGIPDKKLIYQVTRSYYAELVKEGVRIYEYSPGFIHAKQCVSDDEIATVGTINLDYRSLYLNFENGVFLYHCNAVSAIKKDFDQILPLCEEVTEKYMYGRSTILKTGQCF